MAEKVVLTVTFCPCATVAVTQKVLQNQNIAGIRDRDFDFLDDSTLDTTHKWSEIRRKQSNRLGWYWERREIENYLIDPVVVEHALRDKMPDMIQYRAELARLADQYADYVAARIALSVFRTKLRKNVLTLETQWTSGGGFSEADCRDNIRRIVGVYAKSGQDSISESDVIAEFDRWLPRCRSGGDYHQNYLVYFPGKDFRKEIDRRLNDFGLGQIKNSFEANVLNGIENSNDPHNPVWEWLPEWKALREAVEKYPYN